MIPERNETSEISTEEKILRLLRVFRENLHGSDLLICLLYTAAHSFRLKRCLNPFPPGFNSEDMDDLEKLKNLCKSIPSISNILEHPENLSSKAINLLDWIFFHERQPYVKLVDFADIISRTKLNIPQKPSHVFEVIYPKRRERTEKCNIIMAFHGSKLENFHSILKFGLRQCVGLGEAHLFGEGIYLATDLSVSIIFSPFSFTWQNSILGQQLSIIAICEVLDDKLKVKRQDANAEGRSIIPGSGRLPAQYLLVTDDEMVTVKYLLVYGKYENSVKVWASQNIFVIAFVLYFLMLCLVGSSNSMIWSRLWNGYVKKYLLFQ